MDLSTKAIGNMTKLMGMDVSYIPMVTAIVVSGSTTELTVKEPIVMQMVQSMLATGKKTRSMDMV